MIGMSVVFHVASALALVWLVHGLLKMQRQRNVLRRLILVAQSDSIAPSPKGGLSSLGLANRIVVDYPVRLLERYAAALGVPSERETSHLGEPMRIELVPLSKLFLNSEVRLIRYLNQPSAGNNDTLVIELHVAGLRAGYEDLVAELEAALGSAVRVNMVDVTSQSQGHIPGA